MTRLLLESNPSPSTRPMLRVHHRAEGLAQTIPALGASYTPRQIIIAVFIILSAVNTQDACRVSLERYSRVPTVPVCHLQPQLLTKTGRSRTIHHHFVVYFRTEQCCPQSHDLCLIVPITWEKKKSHSRKPFCAEIGHVAPVDHIGAFYSHGTQEGWIWCILESSLPNIGSCEGETG